MAHSTTANSRASPPLPSTLWISDSDELNAAPIPGAVLPAWARGASGPNTTHRPAHTYALRSFLFCAICHRRMFGKLRRARLCDDSERGFHAFPGSQHGLVGVRLEVCVALGGLEALVAQKVLDFVKRDSLLYQP